MGVRFLKLFLHITKREQRLRLEARLATPAKRWKLTQSDIDDRKLWPHFQQAYEDVLSRCSTPHAPWYVVPADKKWFRDVLVARLVRATLEDMAPKLPKPAFDPARVVIPR